MGQPFVVTLIPEFQPGTTPAHLQLSGGATRVNGGFKLGAGPETLNNHGDLTENLKGSLKYTGVVDSIQITATATNFKFEASAGSAHAELVGNVTLTAPRAVMLNNADLLDLELSKGAVANGGTFTAYNEVPGHLSNQSAQIAAGAGLPFPQGFVIAETSFGIPVA